MSKSLQSAYFEVSLKLPVEDMKVKQRLDRGYDIVRSYGYSVTKMDDGSYRVYKASTTLLEDTSARYTIINGECTCPDYPTARGNLCKHRIATMLLEEMEK